MQMNGLRSAGSSRRSSTVGLVGALLGSMLLTGVVQAATVTILIEHYVFSPSPVTIVTGTTVTWVNKDPTEHSIVSDTGAFPKSAVLKTGDKYSVKFSKAGTYNYHDGFSTLVRGTIVVTGPTVTPKPTPRPTPKPTPKPTAAPTVAATPTAEPTPTAIAEATPAPTGTEPAGSGTPGSSPTAAPTGSGGDGAPASGGAFDLGSIVAGLGLAVLLFLAWVGFQTLRRNRPGPPTGGAGGGSGGGGSSGDGSGGGGGAGG
ncbi:MAG: copper binding protein, partial [Chloroflexi bacterium]|nr:copper binding protein [Chloroflexota bacterium]